MRNTSIVKLALILMVCFGCGALAARGDVPQGKLNLTDRWFMFSTNLAVDKNLDQMETLLTRAQQAGYTGVMLTDSKFGNLPAMDAHYFGNVAKARAAADKHHIEIIPGVFPFGWSNGLLAQDPNLAEGLAVKDALFVMQGGQAHLVADPPVALHGIGEMAKFKKEIWKDPNVSDDHGKIREDLNGKNSRFVETIAVHPYRQYHIAVKLKTQQVRGTPQVAVLANGHELAYAELGAKPTQDWTRCDVVFNSLENTQVSIYFGLWDGTSGTVWWDEPVIDEVGLLNVLRRDGTPLAVALEDGNVLKEGTDYANIVDPRMGTVPWKGEYEVWHQPPMIKTGLPDGTRLRVSYYHAMVILGGSVTACPSDPKTMELLKDQAKRMHAAWQAKAYFMEHDEIRMMNQDAACTEKHLDAGGILAENVRACVKILKDVNPGGRIYVWSDMFDPNHNARKDYYLVHGDLKGSWEGLGKDVIIALWDQEKREKSMEFFAGLGHPMLMAGYYDAPVAGVRQWLDSAEKYPGVNGIMYTTWQADFGKLEAFEKIVDEYRK